MPYITEDEKSMLALGQPPTTVGQLTYAITRECNAFMHGRGATRFTTIAWVMGALFCAALEFYRRRAVPYEETKIAANGDVYL
jgi:hypothetical protein